MATHLGEALQKAGRTDLIGFDAKCLIRPYPPKQNRQKPDSGTSPRPRRSDRRRR